MAKKTASPWLTDFERIVGGIFFLLYLIVFPLLMGWIFRGVEFLLGISLSPAEENALYYYIAFILTILIFYNFIGKTTHRFFSGLGHTLAAAGAGIVAFYGFNELLFRLTAVVLGNQLNLNDITISAQIHDAPRPTLLIVIFLAPFVEEVLFRGYVFGMFRGHSRILAWGVSCLLFAFLHVWQFTTGPWTLWTAVLLVQYLVPGLVLAWTYERCGSLWGPILLHMAVNALSVWLN